MNIIELQFKNGTRESFPYESISVNDNIISIKYDNKETLVDRADLKYYSVEKIKEAKE